MKVTIKQVTNVSKRGLRQFVEFPKTLYKGEPNFIPSLDSDEFNTLLPDRNKAFDFCEAIYFLAYDEDNKVVGRIAGIINHKANKIWNANHVRFGWIDFVEDIEVAKALIEAVEAWGKDKGCDECVGPLGFTDMDKEGMQVDNFQNEGTFTTIYNFAYYPEFMEKLGYEKDVDWVQDIIRPGTEVPEKLTRLSDVCKKRFGLHVVKDMKMKEVGKRYGRALFHCCNESFKNLYEFTPLTDEQIDDYVAQYLGFASLDLLSIIVDDKTDEVAGFAFTFPSMSKAYKKANGSFIRGAFHMLKALKTYESNEMLMIGVRPEYQSKGVAAIIFADIYEKYVRLGVKKCITNPRLEKNEAVLSLFYVYKPEHYMRRRCYKKGL